MSVPVQPVGLSAGAPVMSYEQAQGRLADLSIQTAYSRSMRPLLLNAREPKYVSA